MTQTNKDKQGCRLFCKNMNPSSYKCPNACDAYKCCSNRPPVSLTPPPIGYYSPYSAPGTPDYQVQMQRVFFGRPCWAPEGKVCACDTYLLK